MINMPTKTARLHSMNAFHIDMLSTRHPDPGKAVHVLTGRQSMSQDPFSPKVGVCG